MYMYWMGPYVLDGSIYINWMGPFISIALPQVSGAVKSQKCVISILCHI